MTTNEFFAALKDAAPSYHWSLRSNKQRIRGTHKETGRLVDPITAISNRLYNLDRVENAGSSLDLSVRDRNNIINASDRAASIAPPEEKAIRAEIVKILNLV